MNKLSWPEGWSIQSFHLALLAVRQHRVPDFSADVGLPPKSVRQIVAEIEELSKKSGFYLFDSRAKPEPWQPAPHIPRVVLEAIEKIYVRDYTNPERILKLDAEGQGPELLLTRACKGCNDIIVVTIGMAAASIKRFNLQGEKYSPPVYCLACKKRIRRSTLHASVGARVESKKAAEPTTPAKEVITE